MGTAGPVSAAPSRPVAVVPTRRRPRSAADLTRTGLLTAIYLGILLVFLAPLAYSFLTSIKTEAQMSLANAPVLPSDPRTFDWNGKTYPVYYVPMPDGTTRELALVRKGRQDSDFVDPANPDAGQINWVGAWRSLSQPWETSPHFENYAQVWDEIDFPRHLLNTLILAGVTTIGTVLSCTLVAYGFARFRFPGRTALFTLVLSTIFLPAAVTLIPTYAVFVKIGWVGTYLPLLVPTFFANAYDVFLLRQYLMTIPRDHDEAAMIDGAGPLRILRSVILPQAWPVMVAVAIFTFVYSWNDYFGPLIYLAGHEDMQPLQVALAHFQSIYHSETALIQAGNIMTLLIPVILFFIFQRMFIRGIVITGVEK